MGGRGFIFLLLLTTITSCEQDIEEDFSNKNESPFTMKILYEDDIKANSVISQQLDELFLKDNQPNTSARQIYNSEYNFTVNTDYSKYIESSDGSIHSYTFLIERPEYNELEENLVLTSQPNGSYKAEIISYKRISDNQLEMKTTPLENFNTSAYTSARTITTITCTTTITFLSTPISDCCSENVVIDVSTDCYVQYFLSPNIDESTGGSSSSSDGPGGGGLLGTTIIEVITTPDGNTETNTITSPIIESSINKLTRQTNSNRIKTRITQMKSELNSAQKEQGSEFRIIDNSNLPFTPSPYIYNEEILPDSQTYFDGVRFSPPYTNSQVRLHMHHNTTRVNDNGEIEKIQTVFSTEDVFGMAGFYKYKKDLVPSGTLVPNDYFDISSILVSRRGLYALRVLDPATVLEFNDYIENSPKYREKLLENYKTYVLQKTKDNCGNCTDAEEEA